MLIKARLQPDGSVIAFRASNQAKLPELEANPSNVDHIKALTPLYRLASAKYFSHSSTQSGTIEAEGFSDEDAASEFASWVLDSLIPVDPVSSHSRVASGGWMVQISAQFQWAFTALSTRNSQKITFSPPEKNVDGRCEGVFWLKFFFAIF